MLIKRKKLLDIEMGKDYLDVGEGATSLQLELHKARQQAKAIKQEAQNILLDAQNKLKDAEAKAEEIIENANLEADQIKGKVYQETLNLANQDANQIKNEANALLQTLFRVKQEALLSAHNEIIKVALDLAEKIIKYQVSVDQNILKTQVIEAIKRATSEADRIQVFVNPVDLSKLSENILEIEKLFPSGIEIVPLTNDAIDPGSCVVETRSGQLDATFTTQLKTLANLTKHLEIVEPKINMQEEEIIKSEEQELKVIPNEEPQQEELLGEEPLINFPKEEGEGFPFSQEEAQGNIVEIPEEIVQNIRSKPQENIQSAKKRKLSVGDLIKRTREEAEELDEDVLGKEEKKETKSESILKPKKKPLKPNVSDIVTELEKNQEWKDLVEEDEA